MTFNNTFKPPTKRRKWSLEEGYPLGETYDVFPRRTFINGLEGGLSIDAIYTNISHLDYMCEDSLQGFKVVLHHPCEFPNMESHFRLPLDEAVLVGIKPEMITVLPELRHYSPKDRQCYFTHERELASYRIYTQHNCLQECIANYTWERCKCIPFYHALAEEDVDICRPADENCIKETKLKYLEIESNTETTGRQCDCLPLCTSLSYNVEISQTEWEWRNAPHIIDVNDSLNFSAVVENTHLSKLHVYYKELQFLTRERKELYGLVDFFSNVGGLLGLFIGFSVISAIEILYFCTLRIVCNIGKYGRSAWSGEQEAIDLK